MPAIAENRTSRSVLALTWQILYRISSYMFLLPITYSSPCCGSRSCVSISANSPTRKCGSQLSSR